jgi:hypothetical protein
MSPAGSNSLETIVENIRRNPGRMIAPNEFASLIDDLDVSRVMDCLSPGMTEEDLIGILRLTMLTECATETYAASLEANASRYGAGWLYSFTHDVWTPDELTHATPYKIMLLHLGFEEAELDRQIRETRAQFLEHRSGETPLHLTTYGCSRIRHRQMARRDLEDASRVVPPSCPHGSQGEAPRNRAPSVVPRHDSGPNRA